jgi:hypothetical protein
MGMSRTSDAVRDLAAAIENVAPGHHALYVQALEAVANVARAELVSDLQIGFSTSDEVEIRH